MEAERESAVVRYDMCTYALACQKLTIVASSWDNDLYNARRASIYTIVTICFYFNQKSWKWKSREKHIYPPPLPQKRPPRCRHEGCFTSESCDAGMSAGARTICVNRHGDGSLTSLSKKLLCIGIISPYTMLIAIKQENYGNITEITFRWKLTLCWICEPLIRVPYDPKFMLLVSQPAPPASIT